MADEINVTCLFTIDVCARLTVDAFCCLPCCCACGGCCGKYRSCVVGASEIEKTFSPPAPGFDRFMETCFVQASAACLMPFSLCGCLWACCGLATPCTAYVVDTIKSRDTSKVLTQTIPMAAPKQHVMSS